jgi:hypothetical protein
MVIVGVFGVIYRIQLFLVQVIETDEKADSALPLFLSN